MEQKRIIESNEDLKKLDEKYDIEINSGYLLIHRTPYVNSKKEICYGVLVSKLSLSGEKTQKPGDHTCYFQSKHHPCNKDGITLTTIKHQSYSNKEIFSDFKVQFSFSNKPLEGYKDYFHKMTNYISIIGNEAQAIGQSVSAKKSSTNTRQSNKAESPFVYEDTNSSRAEIGKISDKFFNMKIAIIGLGGTGSYLLDFIAKTKIKEIHLFDNDCLQSHNAFRTPGAVPIDILNQSPKKVSYLYDVYSKMKNGIYKYEYQITKEKLEKLVKQDNITFDFVFICIDRGSVKKDIIEVLCDNYIPFIDVGIGMVKNDKESLLASVRTTMGDSRKKDHFSKYISFDDNAEEDIYAAPNIQIAEINAINAALAIVRWKKEIGFYASNKKKEYHSVYDSTNNKIINEEII